MNRRKFLGSLGLIVGAAGASPILLIPEFEPVRRAGPRVVEEIAIVNGECVVFYILRARASRGLRGRSPGILS